MIVLAAGVSVLLGWRGALPLLGSILAHGPSSRPVTGACLVALSTGLIAARLTKAGHLGVASRWVWGATILGTLALAIALLAQLFFLPTDATRPASPHTVVSMASLAIAIAVSFGPTTRCRRVSVVLALVGAAVPWLALLGYASGVRFFYAFPAAPEVGMSLVSASTLILLSVGVLGLWPDHGYVALLTSGSDGGTLLRWLLPAAMVFPIALGGALHYAEQVGALSLSAGPAVNLGVTSVIIIGLVLWIGLIMKRHDANTHAATEERERILAELQQSLTNLKALQSNLVTVCAWTRRVMDEGKWVQFEEFLEKRLRINVSHSISEEAANEELSHLADDLIEAAQQQKH